MASVGNGKECAKCRKIKPMTAFPKGGRGYDGRRSRCGICHEKEVQRREAKRTQKNPQWVSRAAENSRRIMEQKKAKVASAEPVTPTVIKVKKVRQPQAPVSKVCTRCSEDKPLSAYTKRAASPDGLQMWCRDCFNAYSHNRKMKKRKFSLKTVKPTYEELEDQLQATRELVDLQHDALKTISIYTCALRGLVERTDNEDWMTFAKNGEIIVQGALHLKDRLDDEDEEDQEHVA